MTGWNGFLGAEVGASAALAGLVFVGISINLPRIVAEPGLPGRALETLVILLMSLVECSLLLVPGEPARLVAAEVLVVACGGWAAVVGIQLSDRRGLAAESRPYFALRVVCDQAAVLPFVLAGVSMALGLSGAVYWIVPGVVLVFLVAFMNAWVLLVEIHR